jgi:hypothetical protein
MENTRLRVFRAKPGDSDWLHFQSGSARLLPRLIGDRDARRSSSQTGAPALPASRVDLYRLRAWPSPYLFNRSSLKGQQRRAGRCTS